MTTPKQKGIPLAEDQDSTSGGLQLDTAPAAKPEPSQALQKTRALPEQVTRRGITEPQWRTLCNNLFPGANPNSVLMVWDYCIARRLDPMKKPCHIVPMEVKVKTPSGDRTEWRDVVLPGIYELRTTAQRTGVYLGHSEAVYGPSKKQYGVEAPEWCSMTMYRWNPHAAMRAEFPVKVFFSEVVALKGGQANARWTRAPRQMMAKCTEAGGLREACPDELGGEQTFEEMEGQRHIDTDVSVIDAEPALPKPEQYDEWLLDLKAAATNGVEMFTKAWADSSAARREYLTKTDPDYYDSLKTTAMGTTEMPF